MRTAPGVLLLVGDAEPAADARPAAAEKEPAGSGVAFTEAHGQKEPAGQMFCVADGEPARRKT